MKRPYSTWRMRTGLAVAALYALLGAVGLTLAIPPGYASPIFPAAGLALAAVLHHGRRALPFIWLGSFTLNIGQALLHARELTPATFAAAAGIAIGAAAQAALARWWVQRAPAADWQRLDSEGAIVSLLLRGGVGACMVSATTAVAVLWGLGLIGPQALGFAWWTWYTGDLLGTAVITPLALLYVAPMGELARERRRRIVTPILIALGLSVVLYAGTSHLEHRQIQAQFERDAATVAKRIQDRLIAHQVVLSSLSHFAEAHPDFSYHEFKTFTQAFLEENPDIFALSFNDLVPRGRLRDYEAGIRREFPGGTFRATERDARRNLVGVGDRPDYVIVRYIMPLQGNAPAVGFDINSEPVRRDAIGRARASGRIAVTAPVQLVQEAAVRVGVLALDPVPRPGHPGELAGFAVAVLKVDDLVRIATRGILPEGMHFTVRDGLATEEALRFFSTSSSPAAPAEHHVSSTVSLGDRVWQLEFQADPSYANERRHWFSWGVGVIALLFTGLLQIYLHGMTGRAHAIRRQNEDLLRKQAQLQLAETVFDNTAEGIAVLDGSGAIVSVNPAFTHITGYALDQVRGQPMDVLYADPDPEKFFQDLLPRVAADGKWQGEVVNRHQRGELFTALATITAVLAPDGAVTQYVATFSDITENKAAQNRIEFLAYHDALTELPNRLLGQRRASEAIARANRHGLKVAILFLDLDHFKLVNDTYGHSVGDKLLQAVARRLRAGVRLQDTVCRLSGDEFMLILEDIQKAQEVAAVCDHLLADLARPYRIGVRLLQSSMSVGISLYPGDGESSEDLLRKADTAMFEAKRDGRNTFRFFDAAMNRSVVDFVETRDQLVQALKAQEFVLHFQPQIRLNDGQVAGAEALLRWNHPDKGLVGPGHIISVAEQSGLIVPIGEWVLRRACQQMKTWIDQGLALRTMAVNLSAIQFRTGDIETTLRRVLEDTGLPAGCLELELTESILIGEKDKTLERIRRLKDLGIRLSIDDFGTGYSSMAYLKRLHVDKLKIDSSFAADIASDPEDAAIVRAIIQMAQALGLETTAEGVEVQEAIDVLRALGCDQVQGYYYARPMASGDFEEWVLKRAAPGV